MLSLINPVYGILVFSLIFFVSNLHCYGIVLWKEEFQRNKDFFLIPILKKKEIS